MEKGRRGRCIGFNLSHMADLKKTTSLSYNHSIIALGHISEHINDYFCLKQMLQQNMMEKMTRPGLTCERLGKTIHKMNG